VTDDRPGGPDGRPLHVLFVTPYVPSHLRPRPFHFIRHLTERGHRTTVVSLATSSAELRAAEELRAHVAELHVFRVRPFRSVWNCVKAIPSATPFQAVFALSPPARRLVSRRLRDRSADKVDVAHVEHLRAALLGADPSPVPVVFDAVDCMSRLLFEARRRAPTRLARVAARIDSARTERFEADLVSRYARVLTTSDADRQALASLAKSDAASAGRIEVLANGVDSKYFHPGIVERDPSTLVYVGRMSYHGNVRAVQWLIEEIMPLVWAARPEARLHVVGDAPAPAIRGLAAKHAPRVAVTGYVPDVRPHLQRATISVSSLVYGVGIQNKVLEAMATGTPVVTTPVGCSALQTRDAEHLLMASDRRGFAAHVVRLLEDPDLRERLAAAGRAYVERHHAWSEMGRRLEAIYREVLEESSR